MSIIESFDKTGKEIINPYRVIPPVDNFPETVIAVFSAKFLDLVLANMKPPEISVLSAGGRKIPIYIANYKGIEFGFYHTLLGGPAAAALLEEVFAKGAKRVLFFGSCGSLNKEITSGHFIIPTAAYRDEGTSYHYMEASDFIEIATSNKLAEIFDKLHVPYIRSKTWTTDSFYRETDINVELRKKLGCSVVEMECASVMAVGQFRQKEVYQFLYAADCLDDTNWDKRILGNMPNDMRERILMVAFEIATKISLL